MLFNSTVFLFAFLPVTLLGYLLLHKRDEALALTWLASMSVVFYSYWNIYFTPIIVVSVLANYGLSKLILSLDKPRSYWLLSIGIAANLGALGYYKYSNFFVSSLNDIAGVKLHWADVVLPIGISFFTFQQIAFLVDTFQGKGGERNFIRYATFITFFPQLIAGPIVHHREMMPQFGRLRRSIPMDLASGLTLFIIGLAKKVVIADTIAVQSTSIFTAVAQGTEPGMLEAWIAALCYGLQIYFDFSAYSDMAVGLGRMFGVDLPINFASPYKARSISDFWRRWHITLSRFLRDYVYIPLGGNRKGPHRRSLNLFLTMLIGGAWHGAGWTFVIWGALHGGFLLINHWWRERNIAQTLRKTVLWQGAAWFLTFICVTVAWVPFRAPNLADAVTLWTAMFGLNGLTSIHMRTIIDNDILWVAGLALLQVVFLQNAYQFMGSQKMGMPTRDYPATFVIASKVNWSPTPLWAAAAAIILMLVLLKINDVSEFIYFQF